MARRRRQKPRHDGDTIRVAGRDRPVLDRLRVRGRVYLLLERTGSATRQRYLAFDPSGAPGDELRAVIILPRSTATAQHLRVLKTVSKPSANLPTIRDYEFQDDHAIVVLDWVRGADLKSYLGEVAAGRRPRVSPTEAVRLIRGLAHGISLLHKRFSVVHGDIKPANLILTRHPTRLLPVDFGTAWSAETTAFRDPGDGVQLGYAAPEWHGDPDGVDWRSDLFSTTVVLYELLTLQLPYGQLGGQAGHPNWSAEEIPLDPPGRLSPFASQLPRACWNAIDELVARGLALDPNERFQTPGAWLDAVDWVHQTLHPREPPTGMRGPSTGVIARMTDWLRSRLRRR